jgi:phosphinothricin acetyltransferase
VARRARRRSTSEHLEPSEAAFDTGKLPDHRHVAVDTADTVLGRVTVSAVSDRCVYAGVVEHSVYVDPAAQRRGIGRALLDAVIRSTEAAGIRTIQSGIFPENTASLLLHQRAGFGIVGFRERIGCGHGDRAGLSGGPGRRPRRVIPPAGGRWRCCGYSRRVVARSRTTVPCGELLITMSSHVCRASHNPRP